MGRRWRDARIGRPNEIFHHDRFLIQFTVRPLPHAAVMRSIELFGTQVAPTVRQQLGAGTESVTPA